MSINPVELNRYFAEVDNMSEESLDRYLKHINTCLKNRAALVSRLRGYTIRNLKQKVAKDRTQGIRNATVSKAMVYKILTTLTREELEILQKYVDRRISILSIDKFCEELKKYKEEVQNVI
jgi:hypothetical protein